MFANSGITTFNMYNKAYPEENLIYYCIFGDDFWKHKQLQYFKGLRHTINIAEADCSPGLINVEMLMLVFVLTFTL